MASTTAPPRPRPSAGSRSGAAVAVGCLAAVAALGSLLLAVAHLGIELPLLASLGPGGDTVVVPAAIAFGVGMAVWGAVSFGAFRRTRWVLPVGVVFSVLSILSGLMPYRGVASGVGIALASLVLLTLLSPPGRRAFGR